MATDTYGPDSREYCPSCGHPDVYVTPNGVQIETAPEVVRYHACR